MLAVRCWGLFGVGTRSLPTGDSEEGVVTSHEAREAGRD